jgi:hypothetical protein
MLPAKLQETPSAAAPVEPATPPVGGFGRVLNSIHGLQQRLDDFSVDEVIRASAKAETLIQQLSSIQVKLSGPPLLKQVFSDANRLISEFPEEKFELAALSNLENYPTLNALLTTGNQLQQAVLACPEKPTNPEPSVLKALPSPVSQAEPLPIIAAVLSAPAERTPEHAEPIAGGADKVPQTAGSADDSPAADVASEQTAGAPITETLSDEDDVPGGKRVSARGNSDFDQRLLNDLIKTYGDFAGSPNFPSSSRTTKSAPSKSSKNKTGTMNAPIAPAAIIEVDFHQATPVDMARSKAVIPAKATPAEIVPVLDAQQAEPVEQSVTSLTKHGELDRQLNSITKDYGEKHGELDRQLKSIIKDYGENDLYPRQNSLNVKIAGIVAFALLGLVLGGFYFFKTPAPMTSAPVNSSAQPDAKFSSGSATKSKGGDNANASGTLNRSPSAATNNTKEKK